MLWGVGGNEPPYAGVLIPDFCGALCIEHTPCSLRYVHFPLFVPRRLVKAILVDLI